MKYVSLIRLPESFNSRENFLESPDLKIKLSTSPISLTWVKLLDRLKCIKEAGQSNFHQVTQANYQWLEILQKCAFRYLKYIKQDLEI